MFFKSLAPFKKQKGRYDLAPEQGSKRYAHGGEVGAGVHGEPSVQTDGDRQLVMDTVLAIKNNTPDRNTLMKKFSSKFGGEALKSLMMRIASGEYDETADRISSGLGGEVKGPSGMTDGFPATDPDGRTAMLNDQEFVVPREMNAALGGGDPQRGIAALEGIRKQVMPV